MPFNTAPVRHRFATSSLRGDLRNQQQCRSTLLLDLGAGEEHGIALDFEPLLELVAIVRAKNLSGLSQSDVVEGVVEVCKVDDHPHRDPYARRALFDSERSPGFRKGSGTE